MPVVLSAARDLKSLRCTERLRSLAALRTTEITRRFSDISRAVTLVTSSVLVLVTPLHAQDPADRRFIAGVLATLAQANTTALLPAPAGCGDSVSARVRLCHGLIMTRLAELTTDKVAATRARDLLEGVVAEQPKWPSAWYGLGVARIQAARAGIVSPREGPLQPKGAPNSTGCRVGADPGA